MSPGGETLRAVVFDLGGVIVDVDMKRVAGPWAEATGLPAGGIARLMEYDDVWRDYERGQITTDAYYRHMVDLLGRPMTFEQFGRGWNSIYVGIPAGIADLLAALTGWVRLAALSNTNACHAAYWTQRYAELLAPFERVFTSFEMGVRKPEPECFGQVLDWLELPAGAVAFVDDSAANVAAAEAVGMRGIVAAGTESIARGLRALGLAV